MRLWAIAVLAVLGAAAPAFADPPTAFEPELRRSLNDDLGAAIRALNDTRLSSLSKSAAVGGSLGETLARQGCTSTREAYWTAAARWIASNMTARPMPGRITEDDAWRSDIRARLEATAESIDSAPSKRFLRDGERSLGAPRDAEASLRQRAEWTAALAARLLAEKTQHEARPGTLSPALSFAIWTRGVCDVRQRNAAAVRAHLAGSGYPGVDADLALAYLAASSGDGALIDQVRTAGAERLSPRAAAILDAAKAAFRPPQK